jgi:adenylylsulfate kinase
MNNLMENQNVIWHHSSVTRQLRNQQNKHRSLILWFTGISGSGKSTLAHAVEEKLYQLNYRTFVLDGDNVRHGLSSNLGFSKKDRRENIRRIGEVSKLMIEAGMIVLTAFISPFKDDRSYVRNLVPPGDFLEIYCNASLAVCEKRDVKGFYKSARAGEINNYTGISSPYDEPDSPELVVDTDELNLDESVELVINILIEQCVIEVDRD